MGCVNVYPTVQFLYSNHIQARYISAKVQQLVRTYDNTPDYCSRFLAEAGRIHAEDTAALQVKADSVGSAPTEQLDVEVLVHLVRQNPLYTLAALREGTYVI